MSHRRLVLLVEGDGEVDAVPVLVKRILTEQNLWDSVSLDTNPFRIGGVSSVSERRQEQWIKCLKSALKRPNTGAILAIMDGDPRYWEKTPFCAATAARALVERARDTGAGATYSLGFVFACLEYETWLLAGVESLAGQRLSDGRLGVRPEVGRYGENLESAPRDAKHALGKLMTNGYKPTLDQAELTNLVDLNAIRQRRLRSFTRLERAIVQLASACRSGKHVATPPSG